VAAASAAATRAWHEPGLLLIDIAGDVVVRLIGELGKFALVRNRHDRFRPRQLRPLEHRRQTVLLGDGELGDLPVFAIAAVRLARRLLRRPGAGQSDFDLGPEALNRALGAVFGAEAGMIAHRDLPFGVSLLALARSP